MNLLSMCNGRNSNNLKRCKQSEFQIFFLIFVIKHTSVFLTTCCSLQLLLFFPSPATKFYYFYYSIMNFQWSCEYQFFPLITTTVIVLLPNTLRSDRKLHFLGAVFSLLKCAYLCALNSYIQTVEHLNCTNCLSLEINFFRLFLCYIKKLSLTCAKNVKYCFILITL